MGTVSDGVQWGLTRQRERKRDKGLFITEEKDRTTHQHNQICLCKAWPGASLNACTSLSEAQLRLVGRLAGTLQQDFIFTFCT